METILKVFEIHSSKQIKYMIKCYPKWFKRNFKALLRLKIFKKKKKKKKYLLEGGWKAVMAKLVLDERGHGKMWLMFGLFNNIDLCIQEKNYNGGIYGGRGKSCCPNDYEVEVVVNTCAWLKWSSYKHFGFPIQNDWTKLGFSCPLLNLLKGVAQNTIDKIVWTNAMLCW